MKRSTGRVPERREPGRGAPGSPDARRAGESPWTWLALVACVALALWLQRRALGVFFSPDDLISIEWARGLLPPHPLPFWRILSGRGYFTLALAAFGTNPLPYHVVNWLLHGLTVALIFLLARRWGASPLTATLVAGLFAGSRLTVAALLQAVGIGEILALDFTLLAFLALEPARPRRLVLSGLLFAAALLSKESVALLPLVLLLPLVPGGSPRWRIASAGLLLAEGAVFLAAFLLAGGRSTAFGGAAYATGYAANLLQNLMTYLYWIGDFRSLVPDLWGHVMPEAWRAGVFVAIAIGALTAVGWRGSARPAAGLAWFLLALAPVLPLLNHSYLHYAYAALVGLALVLAEGLAALIARGSGRLLSPRAGWAVAVAVVALHAFASDALLARRWERKVPGLDLHYDPYLRKSELARHAAGSLAAASLPPHARLVIVAPFESSERVRPATGEALGDSSIAGADLLRGVLDQGRALRGLRPGLDSVAIVNRWTRAYRGFDIVVNSPDGYLFDLGTGPAAHLQLVSDLLAGGLHQVAVEHIAEVMPDYADDPGLPLGFARELAQAGRGPQAVTLARWVMARFPGSGAARAADSLARAIAAGTVR